MIRKRVYRLPSSGNKWRFSGGVFVTFDGKERAQMFMNQYAAGGTDQLTYHGDALRLKWQADFYKEKRLFTEELARIM